MAFARSRRGRDLPPKRGQGLLVTRLQCVCGTAIRIRGASLVFGLCLSLGFSDCVGSFDQRQAVLKGARCISYLAVGLELHHVVLLPFRAWMTDTWFSLRS